MSGAFQDDPARARTQKLAAREPTRTGRTAPAPGTTTSEARARGMRIVRPDRDEVVVPLHEDQRYVVGRHDAADVVFNASAVSRLHGVLACEAGAWTWEDFGSSNGSTVARASGERTRAPEREKVALEAGDAVELGTSDARVELLADAPTAPAAARDDDTAMSEAARSFEERIGLAARTRVPVFLLGPSGSGKTHAARRLHERGAAEGPFVSLNCARLPQDPAALHSELLGHVKGAFTGAHDERTGKLFLAEGGTLFLDEVESLAELGQGFLLDVLEGTGDLSPLGTHRPGVRPPIFRLVSASKRPLGDSGLRADLCERLAEGHMWTMPTLEERVADIPGLVRAFADEQSRLLGVDVVLEDDAIRLCQSTRWDGQIRQLRATVIALAQLALARSDEGAGAVHLRRRDFERHLQERAAAFGTSAPRARSDDDDDLRTKADPRALTREQLLEILEEHGGNQAAAARHLGIARNTLAKRVREFDIDLDALRAG